MIKLTRKGILCLQGPLKALKVLKVQILPVGNFSEQETMINVNLFTVTLNIVLFVNCSMLIHIYFY